MTFKCEPNGVDFIQTAPIKIINSVELNTTAENVFAALEDPNTWLEWFPDMTAAKWMGTPGVGTDRVVKLNHVLSITEHFIEWNPPYSMAFHLTKTTLPFADSLVEHYNIEETENGVRFTYSVGLKLHKFISPLKIIAEPLMSKSFEGAIEGFKQYIDNKYA